MGAAYQLDVCLPRLRLSPHQLMLLEVWLVWALSDLKGLACTQLGLFAMHKTHPCAHHLQKMAMARAQKARVMVNSRGTTTLDPDTTWYAHDALVLLPFGMLLVLAEGQSSLEGCHSWVTLPVCNMIQFAAG